MDIDPQHASSALVSIVSLLGLFKRERGAAKAHDHQEFLEWLQYHRHEELKELIIKQPPLRTGIDDLLRKDVNEMSQKLDLVLEVVVSLLASMKDFKEVADAVKPKVELSDQAISILNQFVQSGSDKMIFNFTSPIIVLMLGNTTVGYSDARCLQDDLDKLVELRLLSRKNDGRFQRFGLTHAAIKYIAALDDPPKQPPIAKQTKARPHQDQAEDNFDYLRGEPLP
jgi:hypothetical protein